MEFYHHSAQHGRCTAMCFIFYIAAAQLYRLIYPDLFTYGQIFILHPKYSQSVNYNIYRAVKINTMLLSWFQDIGVCRWAKPSHLQYTVYETGSQAGNLRSRPGEKHS